MRGAVPDTRQDGISAALIVALLAAKLGLRIVVVSRLDELAREYGLHATDQVSVRVSDLAIGAAVDRLRAAPPSTLGGLPVTGVEDLSLGGAGLPPTEGLRYWLDRGSRGCGSGRVMVRPSGTEPKLKCYLEFVVDVTVRSTTRGHWRKRYCTTSAPTASRLGLDLSR